jgi:hypothetical protein
MPHTALNNLKIILFLLPASEKDDHEYSHEIRSDDKDSGEREEYRNVIAKNEMVAKKRRQLKTQQQQQQQQKKKKKRDNIRLNTRQLVNSIEELISNRRENRIRTVNNAIQYRDRISSIGNLMVRKMMTNIQNADIPQSTMVV